MDNLTHVISDYVTQHIQAQAKNISGAKAELRAVFNGPPMFILEPVFEHLVGNGGLKVILGDGTSLVVPVLLQVDSFESGDANPIRLNMSGKCDHNHLLDLRNSPEIRISLCLVPPGGNTNLSLTSTRSEFGISSKNSLATASVSDWLDDEFIRYLIDYILNNNLLTDEVRIEARKLLEKSVLDADRIDSFDFSRLHSWGILSRVFSTNKCIDFPIKFSAACGYPPMADGQIDYDLQRKILDSLSSRFEKFGFGATRDELVTNASEADISDVKNCINHISEKCDVPTAFTSSATNFYSPCNLNTLDVIPDWWTNLTVEKWLIIFDEESVPKPIDLKVSCDNSLAAFSSSSYLVSDGVELSIHFSDEVLVGQEVLVTRSYGSSQNNKREWKIISAGKNIEKLFDDQFPNHKKPIKYSFEIIGSSNSKKKILQIISLKTWAPGIVIHSRSAVKSGLPAELKSNKEGITLETTLELNGYGRHYVDIFTRSGVDVSKSLCKSDQEGRLDDTFVDQITKINDYEYGFEVNPTSNCFYQFNLSRPELKKPDTLRIFLECQESLPEECSSEFERLIKANRQGSSGKVSGNVLVNMQHRSNDLESWILDRSNVSKSFYPLVISEDYASAWRPIFWGSKSFETIFSSGSFLHDPRPNFDEFNPPPLFVESREKIANKIRGDDESGLIVSAKFGEWLVNSNDDLDFITTVENYLQSYLDWLSASPEIAIWSDLVIYNRFENDGQTLIQEPDAVIVSPMHPIKIAWQCIAQRALFDSHRKLPCPAASILDPDSIPDSISLPLRVASGSTKRRIYFSVESSSDYWSILWNSSRLSNLSDMHGHAPFDRDFGIQIGGLSSGFNISQVYKSLNDVSDLLIAKPVLNIMISSSSGMNNPCNEGIIGWTRSQFVSSEDGGLATFSKKIIQVLDSRSSDARPTDSEISNLAEDTNNSVKWFSNVNKELVPDIGIIAQLQTTNESIDETKYGSSLSAGGMIRRRIREQHGNSGGAFLTETRMALPVPPSGDGLTDKLANAITLIENQEPSKYGHSFAPSVSVIQNTLSKSVYAAVSSSAIDPACFLGKWLDGAYLWDYDLPSYSSRAGDNNGYYLLSRIKQIDVESFRAVLNRLPNCTSISDDDINKTIMEVARRGIPTVRGLSRGDLGASGDLGMFISSRILQDVFRDSASESSLFSIIQKSQEAVEIALLVPVDPFKGYLDDLTRAVSKESKKRPDLIIFGLTIHGAKVSCKLTPLEVKYRSSSDPMPLASRREALKQAKSLSDLFQKLLDIGKNQNIELWKITLQHLLVSMVEFGFRVYSQQVSNSEHASEWPQYQSRVISSILSDEIDIKIDLSGRLIVIDGSRLTEPSDSDDDGYYETIAVTHHDAGVIATSNPADIYASLKRIIGNWGIFNDLPPGNRMPQNEKKNLVAKEDKPSKAQEISPELPPATPEGKVDLSKKLTEHVYFNFGSSINNDNDKRSLCLSDTNLNHLNIGVVGDLGTGKTQLLKSLIYQINKSTDYNHGVKPNLLIFDYKKDYSAKEFVDAVGAKVIKPYHLPLNLFDLANSEEQNTPWLHRFRFFADVLDKVFSGVGHVQRANLKTAIKKSYEKCSVLHRSPTIYDVHENYHEIIGPNKADSVSSIIDDLVDMELFDPNISELNSSEEFLKGVVVISLNDLGQDDKTKNMLVAIMLNIFYEHMLKIPKRPFFGENNKFRVIDSYLLVDEADNIMRYEFDVLRKILLQGREFGVGVILASQYLRHFKAGATDYREPLLSWFIHKVPNITSQELSALGFSSDQRVMSDIAEKVKTMGLHECLYKSFDNSGEIIKGLPFYKYIGQLI